jgi:hypothetical protein
MAQDELSDKIEILEDDNIDEIMISDNLGTYYIIKIFQFLYIRIRKNLIIIILLLENCMVENYCY